jgi:hypothetical protein
MIPPYIALNLCDFNQNWFVESYTLLMGINRNLCFYIYKGVYIFFISFRVISTYTRFCMRDVYYVIK